MLGTPDDDGIVKDNDFVAAVDDDAIFSWCVEMNMIIATAVRRAGRGEEAVTLTAQAWEEWQVVYASGLMFSPFCGQFGARSKEAVLCGRLRQEMTSRGVRSYHKRQR